ncbi:MAG: hypothetical protein A2381_05285 [Bdellovibrionales bacterium RIFOXYB1_FULL_37_110]|nr:MAG: hypothetical protein A2417_16765 [Bdellovibrionales bacterium RIFOXYC1_FULL_37_79]OFZ58159.1 MAG: hypothetical protein A2381_05285 [Bdellovibrionales bacterium RIFOXYB1_FULL_37_110]OFZ61848.1 MAG: hypothetical protein A2577_18870 [Bdellovibrionales bacterium RIFOXYD1_FULL_36_51]
MKVFNFILLGIGLLLMTSCDRINLIVENGTGGGSYASKAKVGIKAHLPSPGYEFLEWAGDTQYIEDISSKETYVQLPELNKDETLEIKVQATYAVDPDAKEYNLEVENGSGSGSYLTYSVIVIAANAPEPGYQFDKWSGNIEYLNNPYQSSQKIIMDKEDIALKATYKVKVIPTILPTVHPTVTPTVDPDEVSDPVVIGSSFEDGFFALEEFNGKLYAGAFGYAKKNKVFVYPPHQAASPGFTTGESICAMMEFNGYLYANTENNGEIWRSNDGKNWQKVYTGGQHVGCALAVHGEYIYATSAHYENPSGYIYRTKNGTSWEKVYDSDGEVEYIREIVSFNGKLYAFYVTEQGNTYMLSSASGNKSSWQLTKTPARMFRTRVIGNSLYIGTSTDYSPNTGCGIWKFDGSNFRLLQSISGCSHVSNILKYKNAVVAITTKKWKGTGGGATVMVSCGEDDDWEKIYTFKETESWGLKEYNNSLFVGTKQNGGGGKIYKFDSVGCGVNPDPTPTPKPTPTATATPAPNEKSCSQVEGFVWKLNKDGNTAVLITKKYVSCSIKVNGKSPNVGGGVMDDGRPYFRFKGHPSQFGASAKVEIICSGKTEVTVNIPNTGTRCSYYPGGWGD